ncbi:MAG: EF-hand domain-containing protein [Proteobacteria bacterium]|nr:EF-hand domain-containing protein [Pseudomonadota bacterium]
MRPTAALRFLAVPLAAGLLALAPAAAFAQSAAPAATGNAAPAAKRHATLAQRFADANTTHDGHLTLDQARAGLPATARHFTAIDKDNKGYVTLDDIHAYYKAQRAAKRHALPEETPEKG